MSKQIVELPVEQLKVGLYVSRLDRPWIDSPFLFQGFTIETDEEIAQLRGLCKVVYVEVDVAEAAELKKSRPRMAAEDPKPARPDPFIALNQNLTVHMGQVPAKDPVPLKTELAKAKTEYGEAKQKVSQIFDRLKRGGGLDVPKLETVVDSMVDSVFRNRDAMGWLARMKSKDDYLYSHSLASSVWALALGRHLGLEKDTLRSVGIGAMLLDIGKTQLPIELLKKPGKPDEQEWKQLRSHVQLSLKLVEGDPKADAMVKQMIATHHERTDGSGYPNKLKGEEIPLVGRIAGIVDCYDAMTSDRSYAKGKSTYEAVRELKKLGGVWFQAELVELFIQAVGVFPTGTLVELNTGEVGVVVAQNRFRRLRPEIMLILDRNKKTREQFTIVDLQRAEEDAATGTPSLWIAQGLEPGAYGIDPTEYFL